MSATSKRSGGPSSHAELVVVWAFIAVVVIVVGATNAAVRLTSDEQLPGNPFTLLFEMADGTIAWPASATIVLIATGAVLALVFALIGVLLLRAAGRRSRVDRASSKMARGRDLTALSRRGATESAARLGVQSPGLPIAQTVASGQQLYASWEDVAVDVWGPRTGKSTARAIPSILAAPGAVLATSNKRDLVDATRDLRAQAGPVWVFDPQALVGEAPTWWWNPLSYVTDEVKAQILADVFASASREPGARVDQYFDNAGQQLLTQLILAAALDDRPLTQVYLWLSNPRNDEAVGILEQGGYALLAAGLQNAIELPDKQRAGVYGTALQITGFMTNREAMRWVTPPADTPAPSAPVDNPWLTATATRPQVAQFDPAAFVAGGGTLYSLSKEGRGSAGALVTALTVAVTEAAEAIAKRSPGGRLPVPMVCVLDEAANVCRWRELPNLYSHYGSRGVCVMTILQSWSQGVEVWGREGMRKLWSAANVKVYGGGVAEPEFLAELSQLIGDFDLLTTSTSYGRGQRSTSRSTRREKILDVADLAALPRGRAVVFASGHPAVLVKTQPWMNGPHAEAIRASIRAHDPAAEQTLTPTEAADPATVAFGATA